MSYNILSYYGGIRLENTGAVDSITYKISKYDRKKGTYADSGVGILAPGAKIQAATAGDGKYKFQLNGCSQDSCSFLGLTYANMLGTLIKDTKNFLCNTSQSNVCTSLQSLEVPNLIRGLLFFQFSDACYSLGLSVVINTIDSTLLDEFYSQCESLQFGTNPKWTALIKDLNAAMYLAAYWIELKKLPEAEHESVKEYYMYDEVAPCISNLGLDLTTIKLKFDTATQCCMCNNSFTTIYGSCGGNAGGGGNAGNAGNVSGGGTNPSNPDAGSVPGLNSDGSTTIIYGDNVEVTEQLIANILEQLNNSLYSDSQNNTYITQAFESILNSFFNSTTNTEVLQNLFETLQEIINNEVSSPDIDNTFTEIIEQILEDVINNNPTITSSSEFGSLLIPANQLVISPCNVTGTILVKGDAKSTKSFTFKKTGSGIVVLNVGASSYNITNSNQTINITIPEGGYQILTYAFTGTPGNSVDRSDLVQVVGGTDVQLASMLCYDENSCEETIVVNPPVASFTQNGPLQTPPYTVVLDGSSSTDDNGITNYEWNFGDGTPLVSGQAASVNHTYANAGSYTVTLTVRNAYGLVDSTSQVVRANQPPVARILGATDGVAPLNLNLSGRNSSDSDGTISSYSWAIFEGATPIANLTGRDTTYSLSTAGTYRIVLSVVDNDGASDTEEVEITVQASVNLAPTIQSIGRTPPAGVPIYPNSQATFNLVGISDPEGNGIVSSTWTIIDTDTGANNFGPQTVPGITFNYSFQNLGNYEIRATVLDTAGSVSAPASLAFAVEAVPPGSASAQITGVDKQGTEAPLLVNFTAFTQSPYNDSYTWDFGDGTTATGPNVSHTFQQGGSYTVTLTVRNSIGQASTDTVIVAVGQSLPSMVIAANPPSPVTVGTPITLSAVGSTPGENTEFSYLTWKSGKPNSGSSTGLSFTYQVTYTDPGTYTAEVLGVNRTGGQATATLQIQVVAQIATAFDYATGILTAPANKLLTLRVSTDGYGVPETTGTLKQLNGVNVVSLTARPYYAELGEPDGYNSDQRITSFYMPASGELKLTGLHSPGNIPQGESSNGLIEILDGGVVVGNVSLGTDSGGQNIYNPS